MKGYLISAIKEMCPEKKTIELSKTSFISKRNEIEMDTQGLINLIRRHTRNKKSKKIHIN